MPLRPGIYIVPTSRWYIERTVWLIAGCVLLASTTLAFVCIIVLFIGIAMLRSLRR